jgi:hypothetical protein
LSDLTDDIPDDIADFLNSVTTAADELEAAPPTVPNVPAPRPSEECL